MKILVSVMALAIVLAWPAVGEAQSKKAKARSTTATLQHYVQRRALARAQSLDGRIHSPNPAFDVYDNQGRYVSSDPDPFIRNELSRDPPGRGD